MSEPSVAPPPAPASAGPIRVVPGLLWSGLAAALAAGYLVPYKMAAARVGPAGLVLPMLLSAAALNTLSEVLRGSPLRVSLWAPESRLTWRTAVLLGLASAAGNEAVCRALVTLDPGLVSVTIRTQVIFVALLGMLLLREAVGWRFWAGATLALGGFALLRDVGAGATTLRLSGIAWALLGAACFGAMQIVLRPVVHRIHAVQVNGLRLWLAAAAVAALPGRLAALFRVDASVWALAALAALFGPVLSRLCLMQALRHLPAAHATQALFVAPVFAYGLSGLVLGTWPGLREVVAAAVILVGVALPVWELSPASRRPSPATPPPER